MSRNSLGVLAPVLQDKLGITTAQYSYIVGTFQLAYTKVLPVCGMLLDRTGLRLVLEMNEAAVTPAGIKAYIKLLSSEPRTEGAPLGNHPLTWK